MPRPPMSYDPNVQREIQRKLQLEAESEYERELLRKLGLVEEQWVQSRAEELKDDPTNSFDLSRAHDAARLEYSQLYGPSLTNRYGGVPERMTRFPATEVRGEPTIIEALTGLLGTAGDPASEHSRELITQIDWEDVQSQLEVDDTTMQAIQSAYDVRRRQPDASDVKLENLQDVLTSLQEETPVYERSVPTEPEEPTLMGALGRQYTQNENIPKFNDVQLAYYDSLYNQAREQVREELSSATVPQVLVEGIAVDADQDMSGMPADFQATFNVNKDNPDFQTTRPLNEREINERVETTVGQPWHTDPEAVELFRTDPEQFEREHPNAFGITEGFFGQSLRVLTSLASMPFTSLAHGIETEGVHGARERARVEKAGEEYRDHPYLYAIATGQGLGALTKETLETQNAEPWVQAIGTTAGYVGEIADPIFGIIGGGLRGARVGLQVLSTTKDVGQSLRLGSRAAGHTFLRDPNAVSWVLRGTDNIPGLLPAARRLSNGPGDVRLLIADDIAESVGRHVNAGTLDEAGELAKGIGARLDDVDEIVAGRTPTRSGLIDEAGEQVTAPRKASLTDDELADALSGVVRNNKKAENIVRRTVVAKGENSLHAWTRAIADEPTLLRELQQNIIWGKTLTNVFEATSRISTGLDDIVTLTRNTFVRPGQSAEILKAAGKTDMGRLGKTLSKEEIAENGVYKLNRNQRNLVNDVVKEQRAFGRLSNKLADDIIEQVKNTGGISPDVLFKLVDNTIDSVAQSMKGVTTKAIDKLSDANKIAILEPAVSRSFGKTVFNNWRERFGKTSDVPRDVNIDKILKNAIDETHSIDETLRREVGRIMKEQGIDDKSIALSKAIVGDGKNNVKIIESIIDQIIYSAKPGKDLANKVTIGRAKLTDVLSEEGRIALKELMETIPEGVNISLWDEALRIRNGVEEIVSKQDNLFGVTPGELKHLIKDKDKIPNVLQAGTYYAITEQRILDNAIEQLTKNSPEIRAIKNGDIVSTLDPQLVKGLTPEQVAKINDIYSTQVAAHMLPSIKGDDLADAFDMFRASIGTDVPTPVAAVLFDKVLETGKVINRRSGLGKVFAKDEAASTVDALGRLFQDAEELTWLIGADRAAEFSGKLNASPLRKFNEYVNSELSGIKGKTFLENGQKVLDVLNDVRYTSILAARPRFHGSNVLTGGLITYQTVGHIPGRSMGTAAGIMKNGTHPVKRHIIAVTDEAGRSYTYGQILDAVKKSGVRSELGFQQGLFQSEVVRWLDPKFGKSTHLKIKDYVTNIADQEDLIYRLSAVTEQLKMGRSLDEAVEVGKQSMFDYGNLAKWEKAAVRNFAMFYTFARQNLTHFLRALTDPQQFKRYINIMKAKNGAEGLLETIQGQEFPEQKYRPSYALTRAYLQKREGVFKDVGIYSPSIPALDAMMMFTELVSNNVLTSDRGLTSTIGGFVHPHIGATIGLPSNFQQSTWKVSQSHVYALSESGMGPDEIADILEQTFGGQVIPEIADIEHGAVDGWIYPLSEQAQTNYRKWIALRNLLEPWSLPLKDKDATVNIEEKYRGMNRPGDRLGFSVGLTPIASDRPAQQRIRAMEERLREINDVLKNME